MNEEDELFLLYARQTKILPLKGDQISSSKVSEKTRIKLEAMKKPVIIAELTNASPQKKQITKKNAKISRHFQPDKVLDLHGERRDRAIERVSSLLSTAAFERLSSVLVITGKGLNSGEGGAVLQNEIWSFLKSRKPPFARSIDWAPKHLGGKGAILILF